MKKLVLILLVQSFAVALGQTNLVTTNSWLPTQDLTKAILVANEALGVLPQLVNSQSYLGLGFQAVNEAGVARLNDAKAPFVVHVVRLDHLRGYDPQKNPTNLLLRTGEVIFPVDVDGQVRSSVTVAKVKRMWPASMFGLEKWVIDSFGYAGLAKSLTSVRQKAVDTLKAPSTSFMLVSIPAFNIYFIGYFSGNDLMLIPVFDVPIAGFSREKAQQAREVFATLAILASNYKGRLR